MKHDMAPDEVILLKSANIKLDENRNMVVLFYYRSDKQDKSKSFYRCAMRIDSMDNWKNLQLSVLKENPAEAFRLPMLGINDDYKVFYSRRIFCRADMYRWMGTKFSETKTKTMDSFIANELAPAVAEPFLRKYMIGDVERDITDIDQIPTGQWFIAEKQKKPRKKYGSLVK